MHKYRRPTFVFQAIIIRSMFVEIRLFVVVRKLIALFSGGMMLYQIKK
jgi:hypothetical protein